MIIWKYNPAKEGEIVPLRVLEEHCTTVYKVQEAFHRLTFQKEMCIEMLCGDPYTGQ